MLKIIHTADLHLGTSFSSINSSDTAKKYHKLALINLVNTANDTDTDIILIAGDLFHKNIVEPLFANEIFNILSKAKAKIFISPGNHDYYHKASPYASLKLPDNIFVFKNSTLSYIEISNIRIYGCAFESFNANIDIDKNLDENFINICMVHGDIETDSIYNPINIKDIENLKYDYIAFGHNHNFSGILKSKHSTYASSGVLMGTGFDELGDKGYIIGSVDRGNIALEFKASNLLQFKIIDADVSQINTILDNMTDKEKICLIINLYGNSDDIPDINGENFFDFKIRDNTKKSIDIWSKIDEDNILGLATRIMKQKIDDGTEDEHLINESLELLINVFDV